MFVTSVCRDVAAARGKRVSGEMSGRVGSHDGTVFLPVDAQGVARHVEIHCRAVWDKAVVTRGFRAGGETGRGT